MPAGPVRALRGARGTVARSPCRRPNVGYMGSHIAWSRYLELVDENMRPNWTKRAE